MKLLVIGDLHGRKAAITKQLVDWADYLICTGDFTYTDDIRNIIFKDWNKGIQRPWHEAVNKRKARQLKNKAIQKAHEALKHLDSFNKPVYVLPGNDDFVSIPFNKKTDAFYTKMLKGCTNITPLHLKTRVLTDPHTKQKYSLIGYGCTGWTETEVLKKRSPSKRKEQRIIFPDIFYITLLHKINGLFKKAKYPVIYLSHNTPYNTAIDKILYKESPRYGEHAGSIITRQIIEKHKPIITISGHMHEHFKKIKLNNTPCIDASLGYTGYVLVEINDKKVKTKFVRIPKYKNKKVGQ